MSISCRRKLYHRGVIILSYCAVSGGHVQQQLSQNLAFARNDSFNPQTLHLYNYGLDMVSGVNAGSVWDHLSLACDLRLMSFGLRDSIGSSVHHLAVLLAWEGLALRTRVTAAATGIVQQWHGSQNPILRGS